MGEQESDVIGVMIDLAGATVYGLYLAAVVLGWLA